MGGQTALLLGYYERTDAPDRFGGTCGCAAGGDEKGSRKQ